MSELSKVATAPRPSLNWIYQIVLSVFVFAALFSIEQFLFPLLNGYYQIICINAGIAIILAVSLNLINGITGQFSLGHAGFMAIGAYVCAFFTKEVGGGILDPINLLLGLSIGAICAGVAGFLVGMPSLRLRGDYLAIVTLGFNQIIVSVIRNLKIVGEASGYVGIPKLTSFAWVFGMVFLCILTIKNLAASGLGRSMRAVRDDEIAAEAAGINTTQVKVMAFVFSAMWAGVAGGLQANFIQYANPNDFTFLKSVEIVVSVVLGGLGSITGSALAAAGLKVLEEILREVPGVFWTSIALIALASYWSYIANKVEIKRGFAELISYLRTSKGIVSSIALIAWVLFTSIAWASIGLFVLSFFGSDLTNQIEFRDEISELLVLLTTPLGLCTSLALVALSPYLAYLTSKVQIRHKISGFTSWLRTPVVALILVLCLYYFAFDWLTERKGSLRYILYSIILIVLMLLRPQGLLGRGEWSIGGIKRRFKR